MFDIGKKAKESEQCNLLCSEGAGSSKKALFFGEKEEQENVRLFFSKEKIGAVKPALPRRGGAPKKALFFGEKEEQENVRLFFSKEKIGAV